MKHDSVATLLLLWFGSIIVRAQSDFQSESSSITCFNITIQPKPVQFVNYTKLTIDYRTNRDVIPGQINYQLYNGADGEELFSMKNQSLSNYCLPTSLRCYYLHVIGHGDYYVYDKLIHNKLLLKGSVTLDQPSFVPIGDCGEVYDCDNEDDYQLIYVKDETSELTGPIEGAADEVSSSLQKECLVSSSCYRLKGITSYMLNTKSTRLISHTHHGSISLPHENSCQQAYVCQTEPRLAQTSRGRAILLAASSISSMTSLSNSKSSHYKAACWLIYDDERQLTVDDDNLLQRYILALLYFSTNGNTWERQLNFLTNEHECEWNNLVYHHRAAGTVPNVYYQQGDGVICDSNLNIIELILNRNSLTGQLLPEIAWMTQLQLLDLGGNFLKGNIPLQLNRLQYLQHLNLNGNLFLGPHQLDLQNLVSLKSLHLQNNALSGTLPFLNKVLYCNLNHNFIKGTLPQQWNEDLIYLDMYQNQLTGSLPRGIAQNNTKLQYIDLGQNLLSGNLPRNLLQMKHIHIIWLDRNLLSGSLPGLIGSASLEEFYCDHNILSGSLPSELSKLPNLQTLYLNDNFLTGLFPYELGNLANLENFFIQSNNVSGAVPFSYCAQFTSLEADCDSPQKIKCQCCTYCHGIFEGDDLLPCPSGNLTMSFTSIDSSIGEFVNFYLYTTYGTLMERDRVIMQGTSHQHTICVSISDCFRLLVEDVSAPLQLTVVVNAKLIVNEIVSEGRSNYYFGYSPKSSSLEQNFCHNLELCYSIGRTNTTEREIMNKLVRMTGLTTFTNKSSYNYMALCDWVNYLEFVDPERLDQSELLQHYVLSLFYRHTNGQEWINSERWLTRKSSYCDWHGVTCDSYNIVTDLKIVNNNVRGMIPTEIRELRGMRNLILSSNKITGSLPSTIGLMDLHCLQLNHNELVRGIPPEIGFFKNLIEIDLSHNKLTNSIPAEIGGTALKNLEKINFYNNSISGSLLPSFYNMTSLKVLTIGENFLVGDVSGMKKLDKLEHLDLSGNFFSGSLPISERQTDLEVFQVSSNDFYGTIPSIVRSLTNLKAFIVQKNRLSGRIPSELGGLPKLYHLSVSYNNLKGRIPTELARLQNIELFHLHANSIEGEGDIFYHQIESYISDCGSIVGAPANVHCDTCSTCCNVKGNCLALKSTWPGPQISSLVVSPTTFVFLSIFSGVVICILLLVLGQNLVRIRTKYYQFIVSRDFQSGSAYRFFMSRNIVAKLISFIPVIVQIFILVTFTKAADFSAKSNDWQYSMSCQADSLLCENNKYISTSGRIIFALIIFTFLGKDLFEGIRMICECDTSSNLKGLLSGVIVIFITMATIIVSTLYNFSTGISDTDVLKDAVILLFLNSIDEQTYEFVGTFFPEWVNDIEAEILESINIHIRKYEERVKNENMLRETANEIVTDEYDDEHFTFQIEPALPAFPTERCHGSFSTKEKDSDRSSFHLINLRDRMEKLENELIDVRILLRSALRQRNVTSNYQVNGELIQDNENNVGVETLLDEY